MLVYGDRTDRQEPRAVLAGIESGLVRLAAMPPGLQRHAALVAIFIDAAALAQGVADAAFAKYGADDIAADAEACLQLVTSLAQAMQRSWSSGFVDLGSPPRIGMRTALPEVIEVKRPEGYSLHALYPEAYLAAAARAPQPRAQVIGIRSIGTGLGAAVAVGLGADAPVTLRPVGHPYERRVCLAPALADRLLADQTAAFAVVDEGPGLSGSSFGGIADYLEDHGIAAERIHFFPSHLGALGPRAAPRHSARWQGAKRHVVGFDDLILTASRPAHRLATWIETLVGPLSAPLEDLWAGRWRRLHYAAEADWPPAHIREERRKFLARSGDQTWLVKFAGLGRIGERKLERAQALHAAGFVPESRGLLHGFLVERWHAEARTLDPMQCDRERLIGQVGRYLGFRAARFPAPSGRGASLTELLAMARFNAGEVLGPAAAERLDRRRDGTGRLATRMRPIEVDGRLHSWEWLVLPDGRLLKADALDHHDGYDLVGCQDVAWDVAGAGIELKLSGDETELLCRIVEQVSGSAIDRELLRFLLPCYLAFHLGLYRLAAQGLPAMAAEAKRLERTAQQYAEQLKRVLSKD